MPASRKKSSQVKLFDLSGRQTAQLRTPVARSWALNDIGQAVIPISTVSAREWKWLLQGDFGRFILVTNDNLPDWGGVIYTPRPWEATQTAITAYSGEMLLKTKRGLMAQSVQGCPGDYYAAVINYLAQQSNALVQMADDYYKGGASANQSINYLKPYDFVSTLASDHSMEFALLPSMVNGQLAFTANWYANMGIRTDGSLRQDGNIENKGVVMTEDGLIVNDVLAYFSSIKNATAVGRGVVQVEDKDSIARYGRFQDSIAVNTTSQDVLNAVAQAYVAQNAWPSRSFILKINNKADTFRYLRLGNIIKLLLPQVGINGTGKGVDTFVRIKQMAYDDVTEIVELVADEVQVS
jgi:hypothetical protein